MREADRMRMIHWRKRGEVTLIFQLIVARSQGKSNVDRLYHRPDAARLVYPRKETTVSRRHLAVEFLTKIEAPYWPIGGASRLVPVKLFAHRPVSESLWPFLFPLNCICFE